MSFFSTLRTFSRYLTFAVIEHPENPNMTLSSVLHLISFICWKDHSAEMLYSLHGRRSKSHLNSVRTSFHYFKLKLNPFSSSLLQWH